MEFQGIRFACRSGWHKLIQKAADEMATFSPSWDAAIYGGKEKFGALYLSIGPWDNPSSRDTLAEFKERYRKASLSICEECGKAGRLRFGSGICATRCEEHADFVAPFSEDDGWIVDLPPQGGPIYKDGTQGKY